MHHSMFVHAFVFERNFHELMLTKFISTTCLSAESSEACMGNGKLEDLSIHQLLFNTQKDKAAKYTGTFQRLQAVFDLVPWNSSVADIGTDHALLPIALYLSGKCPNVIGVDCCESPLEVAHQNIERYLQREDHLQWRCSNNVQRGLELAQQKGHSIEARLGDGTDSLKPGEVDTLTIMGMGKNSIIKILEKCEKSLGIKTLVLQPVNSRMADLSRMREWLHDNDWEIEDETIISSANRFYITMLCNLWSESSKVKKVDISLEKKILGKFWQEDWCTEVSSLDQSDRVTETHNISPDDSLIAQYIMHQLQWQEHITKRKIENNAYFQKDLEQLILLQAAFSKTCSSNHDLKQ
mmetsp:Transcript_13490/g.17764  ORF Transcript_13490/g.17764 Transcript_13490/m.17764 type:complete len:352 (-) Transcript_13490:235-1290(-)